MNVKQIVITLCFLGAAVFNCSAVQKVLSVSSPNHKLKIEVSVTDSIVYSVSLNNTTVILPSAISMTLLNRTLGEGDQVENTKTFSTREFNELTVNFSGQYAVVFRAYNEGVAYRFVTHINGAIIVLNEKATFNINGAPAAILQETDNYTSWEGTYVQYPSIADIGLGKRATTPALFNYKDTGIKVVIAESDVFSYPGMYVQKGKSDYMGNWAQFPTKTVMGSWGDFVSVVKERGDFIAKTEGDRSFPWRVIIATDDDRELLNNHLVAKLARPSKIKNISWIKPGKATWEWWHDAILPGADIPSGMNNRNTALYNYYVDFAAANQLEYLMIDAGWSNNYDVTKVNPKLDVRSVIKRAKEKNVGVFLWCVASPLLKDLDKNLEFIKSLGAAGIKVDFFDRDDQQAIESIEKIAKVAAEKKLMVNFHGCSKPTGLEITYPNVVNYEAVRGAECSKWDYSVDPLHHVTIPFVRMIAGPMDYTPGSMRNRTKETFKPVDPGLPSSLGTRCQELAMFVVFNQPLAMLCDSPTEYMKYPDIMKFLAAVPTTFDETKVLDAKVAEYALVAKKKQNKWFIGAMTNWESRTLKLDFSFLPKHKTYELMLYTDAENAGTDAFAYVFKTIKVNSTTILDLPLAKGGGAAAYLSL